MYEPKKVNSLQKKIKRSLHNLRKLPAPLYSLFILIGCCRSFHVTPCRIHFEDNVLPDVSHSDVCTISVFFLTGMRESFHAFLTHPFFCIVSIPTLPSLSGPCLRAGKWEPWLTHWPTT